MTTYTQAKVPTSLTQGGTTTKTCSWTPTKVGNLAVFAYAWQASTSNLTGISSTLSTWATVQGKVSGTAGGTWVFQIFAAIPSSTASDSVSAIFNVAPTAIQVGYTEYTADWLGKNPANWFFGNPATKFAASSTSVSWPSLTGFSFDDLFVGFGFMGGGNFTGTNGTPSGFNYASDGNANPWCWDMTYRVGPSIPLGTQAATGTYFCSSMTFALYPSLVPATVNAGST